MSLVKDNNVRLLLTVWGEEFIDDFFSLSLPSLLAPGNIPALTHHFKTTFVFLTRANQIDLFEAHPAFQQLKKYCEIEFLPIDDLIIVGNYSTTVTLAYDRAIKATGDAMLKTYFVFLVSDYIMADGSLEGLMRYIKKGYSGICAGNFQVIQENMKSYLLGQIDTDTHTLQIKPRVLLEKSLENLHPIVTASIFNQDIVHNYHVNRFYFRQDDQVMAGRFYLLHMLCIKPETMDYKIGSSCDYSFIPEMCASGNIAIIDDSDDYLVIEIQSKYHELDNINWGRYDKDKLTAALLQWTTEQHRQNANQTIYFHARDISPQEKSAIDKKLAVFIDELALGLQKHKAKPFYKHPYWAEPVCTFELQKQQFIKDKNGCEYFGLPAFNRTDPFWKKLYFYLFGVAPRVYLWHYRFREFQSMRKVISENVLQPGRQNIIALYDSYQIDFMRYCNWLKDSLKITHHYHSRNLMAHENQLQALQQSQFDLCILFIKMSDIASVTNTLAVIKKMLKSKGELLILISNEKRNIHLSYNLEREFAKNINTFVKAEYRITNMTTIHNTLTLMGMALVNKMNKLYAYSLKRRFFSYILLGLPIVVICSIKNCVPRIFKKNIGHCTDIAMTLVPNEESNRVMHGSE